MSNLAANTIRIRCVRYRVVVRERIFFVLIFVIIAGLASVSLAQEPAAPANTSESRPSGGIPSNSVLKDMFDAKIKVEWEALKNKDKKAYAELLADDYEGVEVDGRGERTKIQALNELPDTNVFDYTLWGLKVISLGPDAAFVIYENTLQFPPKSVVRF